MKTLLAVLFSIAALSLSFAQPTPNPDEMATVTPAPTAIGVVTNGSTPICDHYRVKLDQITPIASTGGSIRLFTTSSQHPTVIDEVVINPATPVTGGAISAATALVKTSHSYGSATSVFTAAGLKITYESSTSGWAEGPNTKVYLTLASTSANLSAATAGEIDVWVMAHTLR